jgi:hypothetical protein
LAFQITAHLKPSGPKLQRPFIVREPGWILLAANTLNADGTVRKRGAVWVAKDPAGASLSSLNDIARAESDLPDGRPLFPGAVDSPGVTAVQACVVSG